MGNPSLFDDFSKQSRKGIFVIYIQLLFKAFKATWFLGILCIQQFSKVPDIARVWIYVGLFVFFLFFLMRAFLIYSNFLFKVEAQHFILKEGVLRKKNTSISFDRIQNINFKQNIIQQLINVYEVSIETAGSQSTEISIKALTLESAEALKIALTTTKNNKLIDTPKEAKPLLKIGFFELLKVSLTENHLQNLFIFMALVFGLLQQVNEVFENVAYDEVVLNQIDIDSKGILTSIALFAMLLLILIGIGMLSSVVRMVLFHFNLTLFIKDSAFEITQGLLTKKSIILNRSKVQSVTISTNPIKRKLGISFITFKQAASGKVKKRQQKLIRIIGCLPQHISAIKSVLYANKSMDSQVRFSSDSYYLFRMYMRSILALLSINGILIFMLQDLIWLVLNSILIPVLILFVHLKYRKAFYQFDQDVLVVGNGRIETHITYLPLFKVQNIKMKQTLFQKRRNVVNIVLQTASGKIRIPCIEKKRALALYNYILFKVESNTESWI